MYYLFADYFIYIIPAIIITVIAQVRVKSAYNKYSKMRNSRGLTGAAVARQILDDNGLHNVAIERVQGHLSDHYDPRSKVVRLSGDVCDGTSVASLGIAAHEVGHAIQHSTKYAPLGLRNAIIPITQLGSTLSWPLIIAGLIFAMEPLVTVGIVLFSAVVIFQLITLPVEFNASSRAMKTLEQHQILHGQELAGARKVLSAAAMTYIAALLVSILNLLRLLALANRRR